MMQRAIIRHRKHLVLITVRTQHLQIVRIETPSGVGAVRKDVIDIDDAMAQGFGETDKGRFATHHATHALQTVQVQHVLT